MSKKIGYKINIKKVKTPIFLLKSFFVNLYNPTAPKNEIEKFKK